MIPAAVKDLVAAGPSMMLGTRDAKRVPEALRGTAIVVHPDDQKVTVFLNRTTGRRTLDNLADNSRIAVTCSHPVNHQTFQLKGRALEVRDATAEEQGIVESYRASFFALLASVGVVPEVLHRLAFLPLAAVIVEVTEVFDQTPGPGAGARLDAAGASREP
jgi:hypothetical protein